MTSEELDALLEEGLETYTPHTVVNLVLAVDHSAYGPAFPARVDEHLERLAGSGVRLSGSRRNEFPAVSAGYLALRADVLVALRRRAGSATTAGNQEGTSSGDGPVKGT